VEKTRATIFKFSAANATKERRTDDAAQQSVAADSRKRASPARSAGWTVTLTLYQKCSEVLHARNPFRSDPRVVNFGRSIREWIGRIQKLLAVHYMYLAGSENLWVVFMEHPEDGKVHALTSEPVDAAI
jgi:hypothetical protein